MVEGEGRPLRHVSRDLFPGTMLPSGVWTNLAVWGKRKKKTFMICKNRFSELKEHYLTERSYPIKSTSAAESIRRACSRLKSIGNSGKTIRAESIKLGFEWKGGKNNQACAQQPEISYSSLLMVEIKCPLFFFLQKDWIEKG